VSGVSLKRERRAARRLALDVLYEAEIRDELPVDRLAAHQSGGWVVPSAEDDTVEGGEPGPEVSAYARVLIEGVQEHQADIDALIARFADRWAIERMPIVDRTLIRIGVFELLWRDDVPTAVAINEAVELAKSLSTDDSGKFVNGLLGRVAENEQGEDPGEDA
jgi:transcription antitermination protein NusB